MRSLLFRPTTAALLALGLAGAGCSAERFLDIPVISTDSLAALESDAGDPDPGYVMLDLPTPDREGQIVHPDYTTMPDWTPRRYLVATPYSYSNNSLENPTLYARQEGEWLLHGRNPLATSRGGYMSDPDIVALPDRHELWLYFREASTHNTNVIWLIRSNDGLTWDPPQQVLSVPNHMAVSPAIVRKGVQEWMMWSVNASTTGCSSQTTTIELRRSGDGIKWTWPVAVNLNQPTFRIWHIDVQWIASRREFWALYNAKQGTDCRTDALFLATSPDGLTWKTYPSPLLRAGDVPEFQDIVYRSTFSYNPQTDNIRFWFSGATSTRSGYVWRTVTQRRTSADVFAAISAKSGAYFRKQRGRKSPPLWPFDPP